MSDYKKQRERERGREREREREGERERERENGERESYKNIIKQIYAVLVLPSVTSHRTSNISRNSPDFSVPGEP